MDEFFQQLLDAAYYLPPKVAEELAASVSNAYQTYWKLEGKQEAAADLPRRVQEWEQNDRRGPEPTMPQNEEEFYALYPEARKFVQSQPAKDWMPWTKKVDYKINPKASVDDKPFTIEKDFISQFDRTKEAMKSAETVGQAESILVGAATPISVFAAKKQIESKPLNPVGDVRGYVSNFVSGAALKMYEKMPGFVKGIGSFEAWAGWKVGLGGMSTDRNEELKQKPYGEGSIEAMQREDGENDFANDSGIDFGTVYRPGRPDDLERASMLADGPDTNLEAQQQAMDDDWWNRAQFKVGKGEVFDNIQDVTPTVKVAFTTNPSTGENKANVFQWREESLDSAGLSPDMQRRNQRAIVATKVARDRAQELFARSQRAARQGNMEEAFQYREEAASIVKSYKRAEKLINQTPLSSQGRWVLEESIPRAEYESRLEAMHDISEVRSAQQDEYARGWEARNTESYLQQARKAQATARIAAEKVPFRYGNFTIRKALSKKQIAERVNQPVPGPNGNVEAGQLWLTPGEINQIAGYPDVPTSEDITNMVNALDLEYRQYLNQRGKLKLPEGSDANQATDEQLMAAELTKDQQDQLPSRLLYRQARELGTALVAGGRVGEDRNAAGLEALDAKAAAERQWHEKIGAEILTLGQEGRGLGNDPEYLKTIAEHSVYALPQSESIDKSQQMSIDSDMLGLQERSVFDNFNLRSVLGRNLPEPITYEQLQDILAVANEGGDAKQLLGAMGMEERGAPLFQMNMDYGEKNEYARPEITAKNTFNASLTRKEDGTFERQQTTRINQRDREVIHSLQPGDLFYQQSGKQRHLMRFTGSHEFNIKQAMNDPEFMEQWSQREGWSVEHGKEVFQGYLDRGAETAISMSYEPVMDPNVKMPPVEPDRTRVIVGTEMATRDVGEKDARLDSERALPVLGGRQEETENLATAERETQGEEQVQQLKAIGQAPYAFAAQTGLNTGGRKDRARKRVMTRKQSVAWSHASAAGQRAMEKVEESGGTAPAPGAVTRMRLGAKARKMDASATNANVLTSELQAQAKALTGRDIAAKAWDQSMGAYPEGAIAYRDMKTGENILTPDFFNPEKVVAAASPKDRQLSVEEAQLVALIHEDAHGNAPQELRDAIVGTSKRSGYFTRNFSDRNFRIATRVANERGTTMAELQEEAIADIQTFALTGIKRSSLAELEIPPAEMDKFVRMVRKSVTPHKLAMRGPVPDILKKAGYTREMWEDMPQEDADAAIQWEKDRAAGKFKAEAQAETANAATAKAQEATAPTAKEARSKIEWHDEVPMTKERVQGIIDRYAEADPSIKQPNRGRKHEPGRRPASRQAKAQEAAVPSARVQQIPVGDEPPMPDGPVDLPPEPAPEDIRDGDVPTSEQGRPSSTGKKQEAAAPTAAGAGGGGKKPPMKLTPVPGGPDGPEEPPSMNFTAVPGGPDDEEPPQFNVNQPEPEGGPQRARASQGDPAAVASDPRISDAAKFRTALFERQAALEPKMRPQGGYKRYVAAAKAAGVTPMSEKAFNEAQTAEIGRQKNPNIEQGSSGRPALLDRLTRENPGLDATTIGEMATKEQRASVISDLRKNAAYAFESDESLGQVADAMVQSRQLGVAARESELLEESEARAQQQAQEAEVLKDKQWNRRGMPSVATQRGWNAAKAVNYVQGLTDVTPGSKAQGRTLGRARWVDAQGNVVQRESQATGTAFSKGDKTTLDQYEVQAVEDQVDAATQQAFKGPLPKDMGAMLTTVKDRMSKHIKDWLDGMVKEVESNPNSTAVEIMDVKRLQTNAGHLATKLVDQALGSLGEQIGETSKGPDSWKGIRTQRLRGVDEIEAAMKASPKVAEQIKEMFGGAEGAAAAKPTTIEADGAYYSFGNYRDGGGGGFYGQPGRGAWGGFMGGPGQMLYGAYIAKRMLAMTASPFMQEAEYYSEKIGQPAETVAAIGGGGTPVAETAVGTNVRARAMREVMAKGAWQQFGGISDAAYSMIGGSEAFGRLSAGLGLGTGIAGLGFMAGSAAATGMLGTGALATLAGGVVAPLAVATGAAIAGGTGVMELHNALYQNEEPATWGSMTRNLTSAWNFMSAGQRAAGKNGGNVFLTQAMMGLRNYAGLMENVVPGDQMTAFNRIYEPARDVYRAAGYMPTEEAILEEMTPEQREVYLSERDGSFARADKVSGYATGLEKITSEDYGTSISALKLYGRATGDVLPYGDKILDTTRRNFAMGYGSHETASRFEQMRQQLGYLPGEAGPLMDKWLDLDAKSQLQMEMRADQIGRYGGMFAPYYQNPVGGQRLADRWDIRTQVQAQGVQSLMGVAGQFGIQGDDTVMSRINNLGVAGGKVSNVELGDLAAEMSKKYGNAFQTQIASQVMQQLMEMGVNAPEAMGAAGQFGIKNQAQAGAGISWLSTAQQFSSTVAPMDILAASQRQSPWQSQQLAGIAQQIAVTGNIDYGQALQAVAGKNLTNQQVNLLSRASSGDLGAFTQIANQTGQMQFAFQNNAGMPIYTTDMGGFMRFSAGQAAAGNPYGAPMIAGQNNPLSMEQQIAAKYGIDPNSQSGKVLMAGLMGGPTGTSYQVGSTPIGGTMGLQWAYMQQSWQYQQQGFDLQRQQMQADWGYTTRSWVQQDRQRQFQYQFQQTDFARQAERMQMQNDFAIRSEGLQLRRMEAQQGFAERGEALQWQQMQLGQQYSEKFENLSMQRMQANNAFAQRGEEISWKRIELNEKYGGQVAQIGRERMQLYHENQLWGLRFSHATDLMQRDMTREGWQYQDTVRGLQNAWSMEDANENIRYATGRQRRQLVRQRDRMATMQNLEEGETDRQRGNQEKLWAKEDERYRKQEEFLLKIIDLDKQQQEIAENMRLESIELDKESWRLGKEQREYNFEAEKKEWELSRERRLAMFEIDKQQFELGVEQRKAFYAYDLEAFNNQVEQRKANYQFETEELERKKTEYQTMWELENKRIQLEREHAGEMHTLQQQNFELQQNTATLAHEYQLVMQQVTNEYQLQTGYFQEMQRNNPKAILEAITALAQSAGSVNQTAVQNITSLMKTLASANNTTALSLLLQIVQELAG